MPVDPAVTNTAITISPTPRAAPAAPGPTPAPETPVANAVYVSSRYKTRVPARTPVGAPSGLPSSMLAQIEQQSTALALPPSRGEPQTQLKPATSAAPIVFPDAQPAAPEAPPAPAKPALQQEEAFRREARLARQLAAVQAERKAFEAEKKQTAEASRRLALVDQAAINARQDPLRAIQHVLGLSPQQVLNAILGDAGKTPQQKQELALHAMAQRQQAIEQQVTETQKRERAAEAQRKIDRHIEQSILPLFADPAAYPYLRHAASITGEDLAGAIYREQYRRYEASGVTTPPKDIADQAESTYARRAAPLIGEATPGQTARPNTRATEPAQAKARGSQAPTTALQPGQRRPPPKPAYKATFVR